MEFLHDVLWYFEPEGIRHLVETFGLAGICLIIFAETGFFALLPGDSLLVLCGMFAVTVVDPETGATLLPLWPLLAIVPVCGIFGDQVGYWIGTWAGRAIYGWRDVKILGLPIFKTAWLRRTEEFYGRWGRFTIVAARWVPIVRTCAPIVAGVVRMPFRTFLIYNIVGAFTWVWSMVLLGVALQTGLQAVVERFVPGFKVENHIDKIALVIVVLSLLPIVWTVWKERGAKGARAVESAETEGDERVTR